MRRSRKPAALDSAMVLSHNSPKSKANRVLVCGVLCSRPFPSARGAGVPENSRALVFRPAEGFFRLETMVMHEVRIIPGMRDVDSVPSSVSIPHMLHEADRELP